MLNNVWFSTYCKHVAANVLNKEGEVRFSYVQLRTSLTAVEQAHEGLVDPEIAKLFVQIYNTCGEVAGLTSSQETLLLLVLLNIHMAYSLITKHLLDNDSSI